MSHAATDIQSASAHRPAQLSGEQVDAAVSMLAMLAEPTRLRLLWALRDEELGVGTLAARAGCTPSAASQHLAKLRLAGVVVNRADGTARLYRLAGGHVLRLLLESVAQADHTVTGIPDHL